MKTAQITKFTNLHEFLNEIPKYNYNDEQFNLLTFLSQMNWNFINTANETQIDRFVSDFSRQILQFSGREIVIPRLCEIVLNLLSPLSIGSHNNSANNKIDNYEPFLLLIWHLYWNDPGLKKPLQDAIEHVIPHFLGPCVESAAVCVDNLLRLVSWRQFQEDSPFFKYRECHQLFINDFQYAVLEEVVNFAIKIDGRLIKKDLVASETDRHPNITSQMAKLDRVMCLIFEFFNRNCLDNGTELNWPNTENIFKKIKRIYRRKILFYNLPNSLFHVHFILPFIAGFHPSLSRHTCEYLWTVACDAAQSMDIRCSAIRTLAGFVAKFNIIPIDFVYEIVTEMFHWCDKYVEDNIDFPSNSEKHNLFYCIFNGGVVVLLFRIEEMVDHFGSVRQFSAFTHQWYLSRLTMHKSILLKEFPWREEFPRLCKMFISHYLGFIYTIVEDKVLRQPKPTLMVGVPFRHCFLSETMKKLAKYRLSENEHFHLN